MTYKEIEKIAYDELLTDGFQGIYLAEDCGDIYIFYGGDPDETFYGLRTVSVDKNTGVVAWADPSDYLHKLKKIKEMPIDKNYRFLEEIYEGK